MRYLVIVALIFAVGCGESEKTEAQKNGEWVGKNAKAAIESVKDAGKNVSQSAQDFWKGLKKGYNGSS